MCKVKEAVREDRRSLRGCSAWSDPESTDEEATDLEWCLLMKKNYVNFLILK